MTSDCKVLDPCCGARMFYFDKNAPSVLYCDNRGLTEELCDGRTFEICPDLLIDVTDMPFKDCSFPLVVFDPPHLTVGSGWQVEKYGKLPKDWQQWMTKAFSECWRVLANSGTLVFKWYEYRISLDDVLRCAPCKPLFGNRRPRSSKTHWLVFFKDDDDASLERGECEDISTVNGIFKCSECLCTVEEDSVDFGLVNYCPDCGRIVCDGE